MNQHEGNEQDISRAKKVQNGGVHCPMLFFPSYNMPSEPPGPVLVHPDKILKSIVSSNEAQCASLVRFPIRLPSSLANDLKEFSGGLGSNVSQPNLKNLNPEEATLLFTMMNKLAKE